MPNDELTTVADLEVCGLSMRWIETLDRHGTLYIADLLNTPDSVLRTLPNTGPKMIGELHVTLKNWANGVRVKSVHECVQFERPSHRQRTQ
jgi:DNA-directed RNA polymerase alpha subunit